jgi:hypothetical protein
MNYLNLLPDEIQAIIYKNVMKLAIHDTVSKAIRGYGYLNLWLGQIHKPILTDTQKRDLLDAMYPDSQDDRGARAPISGLCHVCDYTTFSTNHRPRSMACVCFAKPSSVGVTEPFLT